MAEADRPARLLRSSTYYSRDRYYFRKWVTFSSAALLMLSGGLPYAFSMYGIALKEALHLTQQQTALLATATNMGGYSAIFAGVFYDKVKRYKRYGPRLCALIGAVFCSTGFYGMYLAGTHAVKMPYLMLLAFAFIANNGSCWLETAAMITCVRNFETERGTVVGILKAFLGLSASLYTTLYVTFCAPDRMSFLFLLATVPAFITVVVSQADTVMVGVLAVTFQQLVHLSTFESNTVSLPLLPTLHSRQDGINFVPFRQVEPHTKSHAFHIALNATVSLAAYQLVSAFYFQHDQSHHEYPSRAVGLIMCAAVSGLMMPLLTIPLVFGGLRAVPLENELESARLAWGHSGDLERSLHAGSVTLRPHSDFIPTVSTAPADPLLQLAPAPDIQDGCDSDEDEGVGATDKANLSTLECFASTDYWLLCVTIALNTGCGLAFINNAGMLVNSLGGDQTLTSVLVSLYSIANCLGRMLTAFVPEKLFKEAAVPRTHFLVICSACTCGVCLLNATGHLDTLPPSAFLTGLLFGFCQGLSPTIVSELFGLANFASNYAALNTMLIVSSFAMATVLVSNVYQAHVAKGEVDCVGPSCFRATFVTCAALCCVAVACSTFLTLRKSSFYRRLRRAVLRERRKRGVTAVQRNQQMILQMMERRMARASEMVSHARAIASDVKRRSTSGAGAKSPGTSAFAAPPPAEPFAAVRSTKEADAPGDMIQALASVLDRAELVLQNGHEDGSDSDVDSLASSQIVSRFSNR